MIDKKAQMAHELSKEAAFNLAGRVLRGGFRAAAGLGGVTSAVSKRVGKAAWGGTKGVYRGVKKLPEPLRSPVVTGVAGTGATAYALSPMGMPQNKPLPMQRY